MFKFMNLIEYNLILKKYILKKDYINKFNKINYDFAFELDIILLKIYLKLFILDY